MLVQRLLHLLKLLSCAVIHLYITYTHALPTHAVSWGCIPSVGTTQVSILIFFSIVFKKYYQIYTVTVT